METETVERALDLSNEAEDKRADVSLGRRSFIPIPEYSENLIFVVVCWS